MRRFVISDALLVGPLLIVCLLPAQERADVGAQLMIPLGGPATVAVTGPEAFAYPAPTLTRTERRAFMVGNSFFKQNWVQAPASAELLAQVASASPSADPFPYSVGFFEKRFDTA